MPECTCHLPSGEAACFIHAPDGTAIPVDDLSKVPIGQDRNIQVISELLQLCADKGDLELLKGALNIVAKRFNIP